MSLPSRFRLKRRPDFARCYAHGRRFVAPRWVVVVYQRDDAGPWRLGLSISRKCGSAVVRNRAKRVLREFFRRQAEFLPAGLDLVVVARRGGDLRGIALDVVEQELTPVLTRIHRAIAAQEASPCTSAAPSPASLLPTSV